MYYQLSVSIQCLLSSNRLTPNLWRYCDYKRSNISSSDERQINRQFWVRQFFRRDCISVFRKVSTSQPADKRSHQMSENTPIYVRTAKSTGFNAGLHETPVAGSTVIRGTDEVPWRHRRPILRVKQQLGTEMCVPSRGTWHICVLNHTKAKMSQNA
jgi:hypothetical protein